MEDAPPTSWTVSSINNSGSFDALSGKVKWGPFFSAPFPTNYAYQVTAPAGAQGEHCFAGTASFAGLDQPIGGEACFSRQVPAVTTWGMLILAMLTATAATIVISRLKRHGGLYDGVP